MIRLYRWFQSLGRRRSIKVLCAFVEAELPWVIPEARKLLADALEVLRWFLSGDLAPAEAEVVKTHVIEAAQFMSTLTCLGPRAHAVCALVEWAGRAAIAPDEECAARCCVFALSNAHRQDSSWGVLDQAMLCASGEGGGGSHGCGTPDLYAIHGGRASGSCTAAVRRH